MLPEGLASTEMMGLLDKKKKTIYVANTNKATREKLHGVMLNSKNEYGGGGRGIIGHSELSDRSKEVPLKMPGWRQ